MNSKAPTLATHDLINYLIGHDDDWCRVLKVIGDEFVGTHGGSSISVLDKNTTTTLLVYALDNYKDDAVVENKDCCDSLASSVLGSEYDRSDDDEAPKRRQLRRERRRFRELWQDQVDSDEFIQREWEEKHYGHAHAKEEYCARYGDDALSEGSISLKSLPVVSFPSDAGKLTSGGIKRSSDASSRDELSDRTKRKAKTESDSTTLNDVTDIRESSTENVVHNAVKDGNILMCYSDCVSELNSKFYVIQDCHLSTQSLFYFITRKSGWHVTGMDNADDCPLGDLSLIDGYICLVRDLEDPSLKALNEILVSRTEIGLPLAPFTRMFQWNEKETDRMEKLLETKKDIARVHDSLDSLRKTFRSIMNQK